jgi:2-polyprenyl-6-methoxyphenol hydroxylase-like FAD-dependent oxidoreductase
LTNIETLKLALEALKTCDGGKSWADPYQRFDKKMVDKAITALRTAIKTAEKQEPVAWMYGCVGRGRMYAEELDDPAAGWQPLYTTPPAAQRKPLTDEQIWLEYQRFWPFHPAEEPRLAKDIAKFARAIEAAHGITGEKT